MLSKLLYILLGIIIFCSSGQVWAEINIPLNPVMELNGSSREDIFNMRRKAVDQVPELGPKNYQPNKRIFGRIEDGKPWWGFLGLCHYGPGKKSILGNSKESGFIANPYLLVGVEGAHGLIAYRRSATSEEFYPQPTQLTWEDSGAWGRVTYNVSDFYAAMVRYQGPDPKSLYLSDYNARDFGFHYLVIDSATSQNITAAFDQKIPILQLIHVGPSCGYPGGCNNKSPLQPELEVHWSQLPARISLKLWKKVPSDATQKADMDFIIDLN